MKTSNALIALTAALSLFPASFLRADLLGDALDAPQLTWTTGGDAPWFAQTAITHDGVDAAQCGNLTNAYQGTWLETTVTGRVSVVYWWKLSADPGYYTLGVATNGNSDWNLGGYGERAWQPAVVSLSGGTNTVRWTYTAPPTDPTNWAGNAAWLDQVLVTNITGLAPVFLVEPPVTLALPENSYYPSNLSALAVGDIPMSLQWKRDGTNLTEAWPIYNVTSPSLTIYPRTQAECGGQFSLVASNQWGMATSAVCTVSIVPSPPYVPPHELSDKVASLGGHFSLYASVYGSAPFAIQWYTNGTAVPGATNQSYGFYPVTSEDDGFYHYVVTNLQGAATSRVAHVTVSTAPPTIVSGPSPEYQEVASGDSASFSAEATGPQWISYSWRKLGDDTELATWQSLYLYNLDPTNSGFHHLIVNNNNGAVTSRVCVLAVAPVTALGLALDTPDLAVTNHHGWYPRWTPEVNATNTHDGLCAARSPEIGDYDGYTFGVSVTGPTNVSFWWRISAGAQAFLEVSVDGSISNSISGETAWQQQTLALPDGDHQLAWTFRKEDAGYVGQDAAWVDQLVLGGSSDPGNATNHTLMAHYTFDDSGFLGEDSSGNGNDIISASGWGPQVHQFDTDNIAGGGAVRFYGESSLNTPTNILASLVGSFTVSAWVKTYQSVGNDHDEAPDGPGVVWAFTDYSMDSTIPIALTGNKAAFWTGNPVEPYDDTLHSTSDVNTGNYVHLAVTRDQLTGAKKLYVNGVLEGTSVGSLRPLTNVMELPGVRVGGWLPEGYDGLLDDLQFYTGVLSATNIAFLYANPGASVPDPTTNPPPVFTLAEALNATNLTFETGMDAPWFAQTNTSHDGVAGAQSGAVGDYDESWLYTSFQGPGTISFWWKVSCDLDADYLEFWVDGSLETRITGEQDWTQVTLNLTSGYHYLQWRYKKDYCCTNGADAAWVDQVQLVQPTTASLNLSIIQQEGDEGEGTSDQKWFLLFPQLNSVTPNVITKHLVQSPNALFQGAIGGDWGSSSRVMATIDALIQECTNGVWTLYINKDDPSEQRYTFSVSISGLDTNLLGPVTIYSPVRGSTNVAPDAPLHWTGPTNLPNLSVQFWTQFGGASGSTNPPSTATNWPSAPARSSGTNFFRVHYQLQDVTNVSFTLPRDAAMNPLQTWNATASLSSEGRSKFVVRSASGGVLLHAQLTPGGLSFSFQTQPGQTHTLEARTNLNTGTWTPLTNFSGDGSVWQFTFPVTNPPTQFIRARTD